MDREFRYPSGPGIYALVDMAQLRSKHRHEWAWVKIANDTRDFDVARQRFNVLAIKKLADFMNAVGSPANGNYRITFKLVELRIPDKTGLIEQEVLSASCSVGWVISLGDD